jgi:hypothetical protein
MVAARVKDVIAGKIYIQVYIPLILSSSMILTCVMRLTAHNFGTSEILILDF